MRSSAIPYYRQLDALRGIAALAVLIQHFLPAGHPVLAFQWGAFGVRLFFVLSGFLITAILLECRASAEATGTGWRGIATAFYAKRALRLIPIYLICVAVGSMMMLDVRRDALWQLLYLQNIKAAFVGYGNSIGHTWTLAVEEQFYLAWPLLVLLLPRHRLWPTLLMLIALAPLSRLGLWAFGFAPRQIYPLPTSHLDELGIGALLAMLRGDRRLPLLLNWSLPIGLLMLAVTGFSDVPFPGGAFIRTGIGITGSSLFFFWLVAKAADGFEGAAGRILNGVVLTSLGTISYGLYLYHPVVVVAAKKLSRHLGLPMPTGTLSYFVTFSLASILVAACSWWLIERPITQLKSYFPYIRSRSSREAILESAVPSDPGCDAIPMLAGTK